MAISKATQKAGEFALHEKDTRRMGLAVSVLLIASRSWRSVCCFAAWRAAIDL